MADFTGGFNAPPIDAATFNAPGSNSNHMSNINQPLMADDMADINFPPTMLPHYAYKQYPNSK